jgi:hypothetical protein
MTDELEDVRKLAHGTYDDVIVVEHRKRSDARATGSSADGTYGTHVVLEMPEGSRVIDRAQTYDIDCVVGGSAPTVGASYRLVVGPPSKSTGLADGTSSGALRYETIER